MKIAWFTPFHKSSAIGKFSKYATLALSEYMNTQQVEPTQQVGRVDILTFEKDELHSTDLNVVYYDKDNIHSLLNDYDLCIYNMGDNIRFHAPIFDVLLLRRGIVIAHDLCIHNFVRGYYTIYDTSDEFKYYDILKKLYGILFLFVLYIYL